MASGSASAAAAPPPAASIDISLPAPIYHEKQRLMRCGVHSLNNLFQRPLYDKFSFDAICDQLTPGQQWTNPHRSMFGIGNYDINVLQYAINREGYDLHWHDARSPISALRLSASSSSSSPPLVVAILVNQTSHRVFSLYKSQHWYPIRLFASGSQWWEVNSVKPTAELLPDVEACCQRLLKEPSTQLLLVVKQGVTREEVYGTATNKAALTAEAESSSAADTETAAAAVGDEQEAKAAAEQAATQRLT